MSNLIRFAKTVQGVEASSKPERVVSDRTVSIPNAKVKESWEEASGPVSSGSSKKGKGFEFPPPEKKSKKDCSKKGISK